MNQNFRKAKAIEENFQAIIAMATMIELPIGTKVRLKDDYPGITHIIDSYNITAQGTYMEFRDGTSLNIDNMDQIEAVCKKEKTDESIHDSDE